MTHEPSSAHKQKHTSHYLRLLNILKGARVSTGNNKSSICTWNQERAKNFESHWIINVLQSTTIYGIQITLLFSPSSPRCICIALKCKWVWRKRQTKSERSAIYKKKGELIERHTFIGRIKTLYPLFKIYSCHFVTLNTFIVPHYGLVTRSHTCATTQSVRTAPEVEWHVICLSSKR